MYIMFDQKLIGSLALKINLLAQNLFVSCTSVFIKNFLISIKIVIEKCVKSQKMV